MDIKWVLLLVLVGIAYTQGRLLTTTTFRDDTFITTHACTQPLTNETVIEDGTTFESLCLFTCLKGDCGNNKTFSIENQDITNVTSLGTANVFDKLFVTLTNLDHAHVHFFYCGHASCTTFRASYKPYKPSEKSVKTGYGISVNALTNGFPVVSFLEKTAKGLQLMVLECENEFCDMYPTPTPWVTDLVDYELEALETAVYFIQKKPVIVVNTGRQVLSYRKDNDNKIISKVLLNYPVSDLQLRSSPASEDTVITFIRQAQPMIGFCAGHLDEGCTVFTPIVSPGDLGSFSLRFTSNTSLEMVFASNQDDGEGIHSTVQYTTCEDTQCQPVQFLAKEVNLNPKQRLLVAIGSTTTTPNVFYQYLNVTSAFYHLECKDQTCVKFDVDKYDPTRTVSSKYQQRVNIIVAIIVLPIIAVATVIVFAVWRIKRHFTDKANSYQPIDA